MENKKKSGMFVLICLDTLNMLLLFALQYIHNSRSPSILVAHQLAILLIPLQYLLGDEAVDGQLDVPALRHEHADHLGHLLEETLVVHYLLRLHQLRDVGVDHQLSVLAQVVLLEQPLLLLAAALVEVQDLLVGVHEQVELVADFLALS